MKMFDVSIIGGGLAGLSASIELAKKKYKVALIEKKQYPFHRVCGEYISFESWDYIKYLGIDLDSLNLPVIDELHFSAESGKELKTKLPLGGFGISRYTLDSLLAKEAELLGVELFQNSNAEEVSFQNQIHTILLRTGEELRSKVVLGSFGKRSKLDLKLNREFVISNKVSKNYVGVKYHIKTELPENVIGLHLFHNGYCGVSKVDGDNTYCMCYLTLADNLKKYNSISEMEEHLFHKNKYLENLVHAEKLYEEPLTISQISFEKKNQIEDHILMIGDSAGLITPLSGNGMSMAMNAAHLVVKFVEQFLKKEISRKEMELSYKKEWNRLFTMRLWVSRKLQTAIYNQKIANVLIELLSRSKRLRTVLISLTHGESFFKPQ